MFVVEQQVPKAAKWWYTQRKNIDMEPEYQRMGGIWSNEDRQFLIDSIVNDYDIPKIYVADFSKIKTNLNKDKKKFAVIDGKQRLEALFLFFENELPLSDSINFEADPTRRLGGLTYKDLLTKHPDIADKIENFPLTVMHVVTDELDRINELFVRLNKGVALTGAEKRNAMIGPIPHLIRRISEHEFFTECIKYTARRGQNLNAAAKLLVFEKSEGIVDTKKIDLDTLVADGKTLKEAEVDFLYESVIGVLDKMVLVFGKRDPILSSQGDIPVYYWLIRNLGKSTLKNTRSLILEFLDKRKENRLLPTNKQDKMYIEYDLASRNANDHSAIEKRVTLLKNYIRQSKNA